MSFEQEYRNFLDSLMKERKGESLRRLQEGHGHAERLFLEKVWWPAVGSFNYLVPEFEVRDFKDGFLCFEIDGFGTHIRNIDRWQYDDHKVKEKPRLCQQSLLQILGRWYGASPPSVELNAKEKRVIQFLIHRCGPVTPGEICRLLPVSDKHARQLLQRLMGKDILKPAAGHVRIRSYELNPAFPLPPGWYSM